MLRKLALIVAISPAIWLSAAHALGLGEIDVNSHLNQRFSAVIPLTSVSSEEAENLLVRLADSDDFSKAGIERADYLSSLTFQVVADAKNPRIVINSKQLAREPFLSFLLDVRSSTGRVLREYTVLLDPPAYGEAAPVAVPAPTAKATSDFYQTAEESAQSKPQA
ncbi:MAG: peptidoglycan-binding protein, partial [Pseudomonadota bacterium]